MIEITITPDTFGEYSYRFTMSGVAHQCPGFPSVDEARKGAEFHIECLFHGWQHEVIDGLGGCYLGPAPLAA